jgi:hypothetical protein
MSFEDIDRRFDHHPPKDEHTIELHKRVREVVKDTAEILDVLLPEGREKALAITKLEESLMWANAGIARA